MALSNTAVPKYYGMFRDAVIRGEIPVNKEISMEMNRIDGGLAEYLMGIVNAKNVPEIMASFKKIILSAYGIKSADGRRLEKGEEISKAFTESPAYDVLFQRLFLSGDVNAASDFINAIIPQIKDDAAQSAAENKNLTVVSVTAQ